MRLFEDIILSEVNKNGFESVLAIFSPHDAPIELAIYGPKGTGKTTFLNSCRKNHASLNESFVVCHANEILASLKIGFNDNFLDRIGDCSILFVDGFETFFEGDEREFRLRTCQLLLDERERKALDTVLISDIPYNRFKSRERQSVIIDSLLKNYQFMEVQPLDESGRVELARIAEEKFGKLNNGRLLSDDAVEFVANSFAPDAASIKTAIQFICMKARDCDCDHVDASAAAMYLSA